MTEGLKELITAVVFLCWICPYAFIGFALAFSAIGVRLRKEYPKGAVFSFAIAAAFAGIIIFSRFALYHDI